jgi:hypothetical protein
VDPGVDLHITKLFGEGVVRTTWPKKEPHLNHSLIEQLYPWLKKVRRRCMPVNPSCSNCSMTFHKGYSLRRSCFTMHTPGLVGGWVGYP